MMGRTVLLVEDEPGLRMTLADRLTAEGYHVETAADGESGERMALAKAYDLILLDIMLPRRNGLDVCRDLRQAGVAAPVLMLTARGQTLDKVLGLKIGADDYVTKPFDMLELMARIEALLRRSSAQPAVTGQHAFGDVRVDLRGTKVLRQGKPVPLAAKEFQLLRYLLEHRGETVSRERLLQEVWGYQASTSTRTVDVHIAWLRQKLERDPREPEWILTVHGLGYKLKE